jgi:anti-sigma factor RsiW
MKRWAHNVTAILPERLLHAYVDVMLPPAKRRAVEVALQRNPELRSMVDSWRRQNADLRRLALLENPPPMPPEMAGVIHRLEGRLRRRAPMECLRIAAVFSLCVAGGVGAAVITQEQLNGSDPIPETAQEAPQAHRAAAASPPVEVTKPLEPSAKAGALAAPAIVPVGTPAGHDEAGRVPAPVLEEHPGETAKIRPANRGTSIEPEAVVPAPSEQAPQAPADPSRET